MQRWAITPEHTVAAVGLPTGDELVIDGRTVSIPRRPSLDTAYRRRRRLCRCWLRPRSAGRQGRARRPEGHREVVHAGRELPVDIGYLIEPESITFPTGDGDAVAMPSTTRRPIPIMSAWRRRRRRCWFRRRPDRPGPPPTPARHSLLDQQGIAVVDVDCGSTGYGRSYRRALNGSWGIADVEDCVAAARYPPNEATSTRNVL